MSGAHRRRLGEYIREQRRQNDLSVRQLAERTGVSNPYLSQIERGLRRPSAEILQQIAAGLRISSEVLYVRAGLLDSDHDTGKAGGGDVVAAIRAEPRLTSRQKEVLVGILEAYCLENEEVQAAEEVSETTRPEEDAVEEDSVHGAGAEVAGTRTAALV